MEHVTCMFVQWGKESLEDWLRDQAGRKLKQRDEEDFKCNVFDTCITMLYITLIHSTVFFHLPRASIC